MGFRDDFPPVTAPVAPVAAASPSFTPPPLARDAEHRPGVVLGLDLTRAQMNEVRRLGFAIAGARLLNRLGLVVSRIQPAPGTSALDALDLLRRSLPTVVFDLDHFYATAACPGERCAAYELIDWSPETNQCGRGLRLGMVDTGVDLAHPALQGQSVTSRIITDDGVASDPGHGTAVASLLVGNGASGFPGLLPAASLYAADTFESVAGRPRTSAEFLAAGLDWLAEQPVDVINASVAGPANRVVLRVIERLQALSIPLVAAAGNGGPAAAPAYPAAYPGPLAVTAVDGRLFPYRQANRGDYVSLAAPGVEIWVPGVDGTGQHQRGTSFAAPFVTAAVAAARARAPEATPVELAGILSARARDLGSPGKDPLYGWGLVQTDGCP